MVLWLYIRFSDRLKFVACRRTLLQHLDPERPSNLMGVNGLESLFKSKRGRQGWVIRRIEGKLVVDGNQFCHQACKYVPFGFNYTRFFEYIADIIRKFSSWGIEPYFVFDGVDKPLKLTSERRMRAVSNSSIPILAYTVFANALSEMRAKIYVADGEGDITCAKVARCLECPVLSSDSDYLLFDIPGGYIDLRRFFDNKLFDSDAPILEAEVFVREEFVNYHFHGNPDFILLYPAILGNGIYPSTGHLLDNRKHWNVETVDILIVQSPTIIASLPGEVKRNFDEVKRYYNCLYPLDPQEILASPIPRCPKPVPGWFSKSYRSREIPYMIFDALVNGTQHHGSSAISVRIRRCCYTILDVPEVIEYRSTRVEVPIRCLEEIPGRLSLDDVENDRDGYRRKRVFDFALRCEENAIQLDTLSEEDRFFMCTIIFWKSSEASPPDFVIKALIACFVRLSNRREREEILPPHRERQSYRFDSRNRSPLNDWQCVYQDALSLFLLLRNPPRNAPCPSRIFDEKIALSLASRGYTIDREIPRFLTDGNLQRKYAELLQVVGLGRRSRR